MLQALWSISCYSFLFRDQSYMIYDKVYCVTRDEIAARSDIKTSISPLYSHCKYRSLRNVMSLHYDVKSWYLLQFTGVYGKMLCMLSDPADISYVST